MFRILKLALISFILFFLLVTGMSLFIPSTVRISRAANFPPHSSDKILKLVQQRNRWSEWHPGFMGSNKPVQTKFTLQTDSVLMLDMYLPGKKIPVVNGWIVHEHGPADSVTLQWYMDFNLRWYPWEKFSSLMFEDSYGKMMETGLANLMSKAW